MEQPELKLAPIMYVGITGGGFIPQCWLHVGNICNSIHCMTKTFSFPIFFFPTLKAEQKRDRYLQSAGLLYKRLELGQANAMRLNSLLVFPVDAEIQ